MEVIKVCVIFATVCLGGQFFFLSACAILTFHVIMFMLKKWLFLENLSTWAPTLSGNTIEGDVRLKR